MNQVQNINLLTKRLTFADFVSGTAKVVFDSKLVNGLKPIRGQVVVVTPFNSATSDSLTVGKALSGTAASANAYLTATDIKGAAALSRVALSGLPVEVNDTAGGIEITATWTGAGAAPTAGELEFQLELGVAGREHHGL